MPFCVTLTLISYVTHDTLRQNDRPVGAGAKEAILNEIESSSASSTQTTRRRTKYIDNETTSWKKRTAFF